LRTHVVVVIPAASVVDADAALVVDADAASVVDADADAYAVAYAVVAVVVAITSDHSQQVAARTHKPFELLFTMSDPPAHLRNILARISMVNDRKQKTTDYK
jgi:hypothetical protein